LNCASASSAPVESQESADRGLGNTACDEQAQVWLAATMSRRAPPRIHPLMNRISG